MKIRKVAQSVGVLGKILNLFSNSDKDTYSCDYLNNNDTYSTNEIKTNKRWIDGKPIYRVVKEYNFQGNYNDSKDISSLNIDTCIHNDSFIIRTSNNEDMEGQYHQSDTDYFRTFIRNKNALEIRSASTYANITAYVILEYTKTTD